MKTHFIVKLYYFLDPREKRCQKVKKKRDADIAEIHERNCNIRGIFLYSNLYKNKHKNNCFMPVCK